MLDQAADLTGVLGFERNGAGARVTVDELERVPELVSFLVAAGARIRRVTPHEPSLEELYFVVRLRAGSPDPAVPAPDADATGQLPAAVEGALAARRQEAAR